MANLKNEAELKKKIINTAALLVGVLAVYFILDAMIKGQIIDRYYARVITQTCINIILAVSLNLILGFTGQLTLGHAGFMSVGAYTAAIFTIKLNSPLIVSLIAGACLAAVFAVLIGYPILRLKGDYLAICTLGFGEIIKVIIQNVEALGGPRGISGIPTRTNFTWVFFVMVIVIIIIRNILKSSQGRAMISIREDEIAAESMGINATKYKLIAFAIGAFFAGVAGGLYAHYLSYIDPGSFDVFGGMGSLSGSVLSGGFLTFLPELLRSLSPELKAYRIIIYAILLILLMIFRPQGLMGTKEIPDLFKSFKFKKKGGDKDVVAQG